MPHRRLALVPPPLTVPHGSSSCGRSSPGISRRSIASSARSTTCSPCSSPPWEPLNSWRRWSPRVQQIADQLHAAEQIDPAAIDLLETAAGNVLACARAHGPVARTTPPHLPLPAPLRMTLIDQPRPHDPECALCRAAAIFDAAAEAARKG